jgi:hypothetical protein
MMRPFRIVVRNLRERAHVPRGVWASEFLRRQRLRVLGRHTGSN